MYLALLALFVLEASQLSVELPEARDNPIGDMYGLVSHTWLASHISKFTLFFIGLCSAYFVEFGFYRLYLAFTVYF